MKKDYITNAQVTATHIHLSMESGTWLSFNKALVSCIAYYPHPLYDTDNLPPEQQLRNLVLYMYRSEAKEDREEWYACTPDIAREIMEIPEEEVTNV